MNHFDRSIALQLDVFRAAAATEIKVVRILKALEKKLIQDLSGDEITAWSRARLTRQLEDTRELIREHYVQARDIAMTASQSTAAVVSTATANSLAASSTTRVTVDFLRTLTKDAIVQGATQAEWWSRQSADVVFRYSSTLRRGIAEGAPNQKIVRDVMQFLNTSRAQAATLVQTSTATVANDARMEMFQANADIIQRLRAVATLDSKTCMRCAPLDGLEWKTNGAPIGHSYTMPHYPIHSNCRCQIIAQVFDDPPGGMRASADGPVKADLTFEGWLSRQPEEVVEEMLGKGRAELYMSGKITLSDLTHGSGRPLTLDQLRAKYD
jgi:SPP1 gp7 family putative phage head morphogenesis protein